MGEEKLLDNRDLDTEGGNYNENIKGDYIQGNKGDAMDQNSSSFGVSVNKENINARNVGETTIAKQYQEAYSDFVQRAWLKRSLEIKSWKSEVLDFLEVF